MAAADELPRFRTEAPPTGQDQHRLRAWEGTWPLFGSRAGRAADSTHPLTPPGKKTLWNQCYVYRLTADPGIGIELKGLGRDIRLSTCENNKQPNDRQFPLFQPS